jgi:hypothetical protein
MDENTELILLKATRPLRWEDEEKATNDMDLLREEFRRRLYPEVETKPQATEGNATAKLDAE